MSSDLGPSELPEEVRLRQVEPVDAARRQRKVASTRRRKKDQEGSARWEGAPFEVHLERVKERGSGDGETAAKKATRKAAKKPTRKDEEKDGAGHGKGEDDDGIRGRVIDTRA
ncbi:MAG: hypothetical protein HY720_09955 [Planctomycetes bacterium]|nr:hypothetical protein [Planctomycetota bacterium]